MSTRDLDVVNLFVEIFVAEQECSPTTRGLIDAMDQELAAPTDPEKAALVSIEEEGI